MSIKELVECDYCDRVVNSSTVPFHWVTYDGEHYCTQDCAIIKWTNYTREGVYRGV